MTDELRRLAEAANDGLPWEFQLRGYDSALDGLDEDTDAYIRAANPQRILALLDVVEAAREAHGEWDAAVKDWMVWWAGGAKGNHLFPVKKARALREALDRLEALR